jgi:methylmalonic aciduria homocystinuria type C protein
LDETSRGQEEEGARQGGIEVELLYDFDFVGRRPKVIVQVAGHVAGQAYYYQRKDIVDPDWKREGTGAGSHVYGCSIHPKYGGWFGFRGVILLKNGVVISQGEEEEEEKGNRKGWKKEILDVVPEQEDRKTLLSYFNAWDVRFRDVVSVKEGDRYSIAFEKFFETPPNERKPIIEETIKQLGLQDSSNK